MTSGLQLVSTRETIGDAHAQRLGDGDVFLRGVDDVDGGRERGHLLDAAEVAVQADDLLFLQQALLLGERFELAAGAGVLQADEVVDAGLDGLEVGQRAAQPARGHEGHAAAAGLGLDRFLGLALGADEEDGAALGDEVADVGAGVFQETDGLLEVQDVDAVALGEDELAHLRVPAPCLVAEVHACFEQGFH